MEHAPETGRHRSHRIAAAFDTEADADAALAELSPLAQEIVIDIHLPGCHDVDEAERNVALTMLKSILVAVPVTIALTLLLGLAFNGTFGDLSVEGVLAVAIGAGGILGILLGGIAGIALSQRRLEEALSPTVAHRAEEVLVAHVQRGALHNPNHRRPEYLGMRTNDVVADLEHRIEEVFEHHHGHLIDA
jgi:hypothetical protein